MSNNDMVPFDDSDSEMELSNGEDTSSKSASQLAVETAQRVQHAKQSAMQTKAAIQSGASAVKGGLAIFWGLVTNPIFWIIIALFIVAGVVFASSQVIGKNENANGCAGISGSVDVGDIPMQGSIADPIAAGNIIASWLMTTSFGFLDDKPMTLEQAGGIIGNMRQESQLTPSISQSGWVPANATNADVRAKGESTGGRAIGLIQWDGGRKKNLLDYADSQNKLWSNVTVQLEFLKIELEDDYEANRLIDRGFNIAGKTVEEYTKIFEESFERAGKPAMESRYKYSRFFIDNFNGAGAVTTGGSCLADAGTFDGSDAVSLALSIALPNHASARVSSGDRLGKTLAPAAYKAAKLAAEEKGGKDPWDGLYASCDRLVATVVKNVYDPDIPWGSTTHQYQYLNGSSKWMKYTKRSEAQPGDVWITVQNGHVIMYVGQHEGKDATVDASYMDRVASIGNASYLTENMVDTSGRKYVGFRYIGG